MRLLSYVWIAFLALLFSTAAQTKSNEKLYVYAVRKKSRAGICEP
jgi:hypothetical protein